MKQRVYSPKSLGAAIKRARKLRKKNQSDAGKSFRLEQSTVSNIERGITGTRIETIFRLLAALDLDMIIQDRSITADSKEEW